jgi:hypothetical protein
VPSSDIDTEPTTESSAKRTRERSAIAFPYEDLEAAAKMVEIAHKQYGGGPSLDQLAARLGSNVGSGSFRLKVSACRMFGFATTSGKAMTVGPLGAQLVDPRTTRAARAEAFLRPALYRAIYDRYQNQMLPDDQGLEQVIRELGVPAKQVTHARQVFQRSAQYAGFFDHGRDRLITPATARIDTEVPIRDADSSKNGGDDGKPDVQQHRLIVGLLDELPPVSDGFSEDDRKDWLKALEMNLSIIYRKSPSLKRSDGEPVTSTHGQTSGDDRDDEFDS